MKIDESWYKKPKNKNFPTQDMAGGIVVRREGGKVMIALVGDKKIPDFILPKGRIEKGESELNAAKREIAEETGLQSLKLIKKLGIKERFTFKKNYWNTYYYFLFVTDQEHGNPDLQEGEKDYFTEWFNIDNLPLMFWPEQGQLIEENREKIKRLIKYA
ncbi:hypothetical protein A2962_00655 [Candidatus Woesebacteria bacterium RIFCSPLOWO2_01_FULL_39_61]|uniref:Nudix hydrolase domain-containing protein n=1 Tax=Candidatus Woesebacteria bacterium RIFCSPHIGHO2_02_FULL_39_13 TaxID=1802505 RepID=A0A1F7Z248_9BACT|nr:MAG: hypothetical protein A2692_04785 [Candidatus Woesebacteria bacterium RIFCSPHIGHO2_01_FULL_39_95]OGM33581.1 MAG: hypothetical protein A3D01_01340 [Candidatus Woesebacteria bacterium RIFCSPHIGHO2_02_FULL_39_13]OGM36689.1 MAG: hypothetical protein A3E13_00150 [Candidatus Woesebacteria bacterium RIFCSPHIGHO2_12_FULL_40_20]OGM68562.1 MAG: hypothetical protein A2962_00655 [Candidatus Woesebacteria bacterium RIFCSPLOWO2_01_FULL_39_61]OGM75033.1 MAG: hypothetical protein A3H19_02110 [Candidatus